MFKYAKKSYGLFALATLFMTIGWVLSVIAIAACNFVSVEGVNEGGAFVGMGLYWFKSPQECVFLTLDRLGGSDNAPYWRSGEMNAARITSAISSVWACCVMCLMWMGVCCGCFHGNCMRKTTGVMSMGICALMGGIFAVFSSSSCSWGCSMAAGAYCAVFSMLSYFICGVICCCIPHSKHDNDDIAQAPPPTSASIAPVGDDTVSVEKTDAPLVAATVGDEKV